jgi:hypothetical protein
MMNEYIWSSEGNNVIFVCKAIDNGKMSVISTVAPNAELFFEYDRNKGYDWTFAKVRRLGEAMKSTIEILMEVPGTLKESIVMLAIWLVGQMPSNIECRFIAIKIKVFI